MGQLVQVRLAQLLEHMQEASAHLFLIEQLESPRDRRPSLPRKSDRIDQLAPIRQAHEFGSFRIGIRGRSATGLHLSQTATKPVEHGLAGATDRDPLQPGRAGHARVLNLGNSP